MKKLYILRHAKSDWSDSSLDDFDRGLKKRGKKDIKLTSFWLKKHNVKPDLVLSSPAKRAKKTLEILKDVLKIKDENIKFDPNIYESNVKYLIDMLSKLDNRKKEVFLIGHNPLLNDLAEFLSDAIITNIPTSGVIAIKFDVKSWNEIKRKKGNIIFFEYPKKLKNRTRIEN